MTPRRPVVVQPPSPSGGCRVRVDSVLLGVAQGPGDLVDFLRRAGLEIEPQEFADSLFVGWQGVGPGRWEV
ncbi:hypothetical protein [Streptomyces sp. NPDC054804]